MSSQFIQYYKNCEDAVSGAQGELLEVLLQLEDDCYPWNPAEPETEAYFAQRERFLGSDWQDEGEISHATQGLFDKMHDCWASLSEPTTETLSEPTTETLKRSLSESFANFIPQGWLDAIASRAQQVVSINLSLADQLVMCVKPLLPGWTDEDLLVLARPLAYAMRGSAAPIGTEWTELSQMEQVRLSIVVAHSALEQLQESRENL